jgi:hypothetical protein
MASKNLHSASRADTVGQTGRAETTGERGEPQTRNDVIGCSPIIPCFRLVSKVLFARSLLGGILTKS